MQQCYSIIYREPCVLYCLQLHTRCSYCHYHLPHSIDYHCRIAYDDISTLHVILSQVGYSLWHLGLAPFYVLLITQHSTDSFLPDIATNTLTSSMDLIHYSFAPLILFRVPYTLDLLPYYLSIANGAGGVGIFELLVFQCFVQKLSS